MRGGSIYWGIAFVLSAGCPALFQLQPAKRVNAELGTERRGETYLKAAAPGLQAGDLLFQRCFNSALFDNYKSPESLQYMKQNISPVCYACSKME